jgi:hypothetical protein
MIRTTKPGALDKKYKVVGVTVSEPGVVATGSALSGGYTDEIMIPVFKRPPSRYRSRF